MTKPQAVKRGAPLALQRKVCRLLEALTPGSFVDAECESLEPVELPFVADELVSRAIEEWRARAFYCPWEPLSDLGWGILLQLLEAEIQGRSASLSSIQNLCAASAGTAGRSLKALERHALVVRGPQPGHPEEDAIGLSRKGSLALRRYFDEVFQARGRN